MFLENILERELRGYRMGSLDIYYGLDDWHTLLEDKMIS